MERAAQPHFQHLDRSLARTRALSYHELGPNSLPIIFAGKVLFPCISTPFLAGGAGSKNTKNLLVVLLLLVVYLSLNLRTG